MSTPILATRSHKSVGLALILAFFFGPFGLFYASLTGGLIMTLTPILLYVSLLLGLLQDNPILAALSLGILLIFALAYWLIILIWAVVSVKNYNDDVDAEADRQFQLFAAMASKEQPKVIVNISPGTDAGQPAVTTSDKPSLQEWLKSNPGKSVNDYFARFGR